MDRLEIELLHRLTKEESVEDASGWMVMGWCKWYRLVQIAPEQAVVFGSCEGLRVVVSEKVTDLLKRVDEWQALEILACMEAYEVTGDEELLSVALTAADGLLQKDTFTDEIMMCRLLCYSYYYTQEEEYAEKAKKLALNCCALYRPAGDCWQEGRMLEMLMTLQEVVGDDQFAEIIVERFERYKLMLTEKVSAVVTTQLLTAGQMWITLSALYKFRSYEVLAEERMEQMKLLVQHSTTDICPVRAFLFYAITVYCFEKRFSLLHT